MGENIRQRNKRIIANKRYQFKHFNTPDTRHVHTRQTNDAQMKKSLKAKTSTRLKITEDQKFQKVVTNTTRVIRLGQEHPYYLE